MRIRHKTRDCLNCGSTLSEAYNYCPVCGQENTNHNLSFGILIKEFFSNYFSFDSRFGRSIKPFLFQPGTLTNSFNEGKRVRYAHPVRLYLLVSLFHFSFFGLNINVTDENGNQSNALEYRISDDTSTVNLDSLIEVKNSGKKYDSTDWPLQEYEFEIIEKMVDLDYSDEAIVDTLQIQDRDWFDRFFITRIVRVMNAEAGDIKDMIIQNIPVMMFFILPIYALILTMFYRRKGLYISHLIHSFHIHSFAFFLLGILWIVLLLLPISEEGEDKLSILAFSLISIYIFFSLKKVYRQSHLKTLGKLIMKGFIYFTVLMFSILLEILISLAFF